MRRGHRGPVAARAVHPHLARRYVVDPVEQLVQGHVDGAVDPRRGELLLAPDVEHDHLTVVAHLGEVGEDAGGER